VTLSLVEREELHAAARGVLARSSTSELVRKVISSEPGFDAELWEQMVHLGWTSIHVDERFGGAGAGYVELAVVIHELGRALTPSPFLASAVLATRAFSLAEHTEMAGPFLQALVEGESVGSVAFAAVDGTYDLNRLDTAWRSRGSAVRLSGASGFVLDADLADVLVVAACGTDGTVAALAVEMDSHGVGVERVPMIDETRRLFTVTFDGVSVSSDRMLCEPGQPAALLFDQVLALGVIAAAGDAVGAAERALEVTTAYARERIQFGRPIGSFQSVKHHCANMAINVEASRAAVGAAVSQLDTDLSAWTTTGSVTASYVGPACSEVCALAMRVHGGIGFTWENDTHLQLKRVKLDELLFGTPAWHRRRLADAVFPALITSDSTGSRRHQ
jgi:alkylation response protein AidB-like acyl-CoA dehydrogenase